MLGVLLLSLSHRILVSAGRNESWLYNVGADEIIICHPNTIKCPKKDSKALDGQALASFVVANYDRLDGTRVVFVHGGKREWHQYKDFPTIVKRAWDVSGFYHLGKLETRKCIHIEKTGWCVNIFAPLNISCPYVCTYQGLQFAMDGNDVKQHTSWIQWKGLATTCNGLDHPPREFGIGYRDVPMLWNTWHKCWLAVPPACPKYVWNCDTCLFYFTLLIKICFRN